MRRLSLTVAALLALGGLALGGSALAMGGGGYGGGSSMTPGSGASFDDYTTAQRLIKHAEYASAIPHLEAALRKRPKDADILNYLGYTHRMVGVGEQDAARDKDFQASLDFYQAALAIDPAHKGVHEYLGEAHRVVARESTGTARDAELRLSAAYYHRVLEQDLNDRDFLAYMGELYLSRDDVKSARDELKALDAACPEGCAEHDRLAASIATYTPPPAP